MIRVELADGIVIVAQLDDAGMCQSLGLDWDYTARGRIVVQAERGALERWRDELLDTSGYDWPAHYHRSCRAAARRITKALEGAI